MGTIAGAIDSLSTFPRVLAICGGATIISPSLGLSLYATDQYVCSRSTPPHRLTFTICPVSPLYVARMVGGIDGSLPAYEAILDVPHLRTQVVERRPLPLKMTDGEVAAVQLLSDPPDKSREPERDAPRSAGANFDP